MNNEELMKVLVEVFETIREAIARLFEAIKKAMSMFDVPRSPFANSPSKVKFEPIMKMSPPSMYIPPMRPIVVYPRSNL